MATSTYELGGGDGELHWPVSYARLEDATPVASQAAAIQSLLDGTQKTGTVLSIDADRSQAIIDFTSNVVYGHGVRNVLTYNAAVENTWGAVNEGDPIYYDRSATMPAGVFLSTSPLDNTGAANPLFGFAALADADDSIYPTAAAATTTAVMAVIQD